MLVLLIACANLATCSLPARGKPYANLGLRGVGRIALSLIRQMLTESVLLAVAAEWLG